MNVWGIRSRVLFLALTPSVMILLALVIYFTYERVAEVDVSLAERGKLVARRLAPGAELALFADDRASLQRLVDTAVRETDVQGIAVADAQGRELVHSGVAPSASADQAMHFSEPVMQTRLATADLPEQLQASSTPAKVGEVTVVMSRSAARIQQRRIMLTGLALGLAGLVIAITLALLIGDGVIRPIRRLAAAMARLGHGEATPPISVAGGGELRTLGEGFNRMATRLQADARELEERIRAATRELQIQKDTAEQATQAKSRFIAAASHDLRQPLHAIGLFTSTLQRRLQSTELEPVAADLGKAVAAMERLFNSLLDISRLDAGTLRADLRAYPLPPLFMQLAAEYAEAAANKGLRLYVHQTDAFVIADDVLLHRILSNLMSNAIRYTRSGSVMLCSRRRGDTVQIEVRDSGIGIAADKHSAIFQEFYQIEDAAGDHVMGLGLGLAIVSRLARLLGTSVQVRSAPGRGSVFCLRLPRAEASAVALPSAGAHASAIPADAPLQVLVVDDDPLVLSGNRALLEELGCKVTTVTDAAQARAAMAGVTQPILVICDMWLGNGSNGIDLLRQLQSLTSTSVSAMLISGDTRPETLQAASAAGYPLLHKPVSPAKLRAVVMHFARKARKQATHDEDTSG